MGTKPLERAIRAGALLATCLAGGCAAAGAVPGFIAAVALALALLGLGCSDGATTEDGTWENCCVDGEVDTCFCPAGAACNYGWYTDCGDGTCSLDPEGCDGDGGTEDAAVDAGGDGGGDGGTWESCCVDGEVDTCFCPAGVACNYGWYTDCGDGTCTSDPGSCEDGGVDAATTL
ncbi:MAG: hypothetical protein ACOCXM_06650 [Myxococcota bacterium]